jgi:hypothetical protein
MVAVHLRSKSAARLKASSRLSNGGDVKSPIPPYRVNLTRKSDTAGWIPTRSATPSTALVPQRKVGFPIPNAGFLLGFQGTKTARREGISSRFSDAGVALRPRTQGGAPRSVFQPRSRRMTSLGGCLDFGVKDLRRWGVWRRPLPQVLSRPVQLLTPYGFGPRRRFDSPCTAGPTGPKHIRLPYCVADLPLFAKRAVIHNLPLRRHKET